MKTIVCGAGRVGRQISRRLVQEKHEVTIVDRDAKLVDESVAGMEVAGVTGYASHPAVLEQAGAIDADMIIAATRSDEVNMVICQVAHSLFNVDIRFARIRSPEYLKSGWDRMFAQKHMPVDKIFHPEQDIAKSIVHWLDAPSTQDVVPFLGGQIRLVRLTLPNDCPVIGQRLGGLSVLFDNPHAIVLTVRRRNDQALVVDRNADLRDGDEVLFVTPTGDLERTNRQFGHKAEKVERLLILGGGNIGKGIVRELNEAKRSIRLDLIERDSKKAQQVSLECPKVTVTEGDVVDPAILAEAGADRADVAVAVTNDSSVNLLAASLAREADARRTLALMPTGKFGSAADRLGIDAVIDPEYVTVSRVLELVHYGTPLQKLCAIPGEPGDVVEMKVQSNSPIDGKTLRDTGMSRYGRVGAVLDSNGALKEVSGDLRFESGDRVVILIKSEGARGIDKLFNLEAHVF